MVTKEKQEMVWWSKAIKLVWKITAQVLNLGKGYAFLVEKWKTMKMKKHQSAILFRYKPILGNTGKKKEVFTVRLTIDSKHYH